VASRASLAEISCDRTERAIPAYAPADVALDAAGGDCFILGHLAQ
jgi:hypothetical protein